MLSPGTYRYCVTLPMKIAGFLLLIAGWMLVLSAVILLGAAGARNAFVMAGLAVELLGLVLAGRAHTSGQGERRDRT